MDDTATIHRRTFFGIASTISLRMVWAFYPDLSGESTEGMAVTYITRGKYRKSHLEEDGQHCTIKQERRN